jgi:hypothetical protein
MSEPVFGIGGDSLFGELDIASASDDPYGVPDDTYKCVVSDLKIAVNSKGNRGMTLTFKVTEGDFVGAEITDYKRLPSDKDKEPLVGKKKEDALSYVKLRLRDLGIPDSRMNSLTREDVIGTECYVSTQRKTVNDSTFTNVRNISLESPGESNGVVVSGQEAVNPFA